MKKMMILAMMMVMTISAKAMSYNAAKNALHSMRQSMRSTSTT